MLLINRQDRERLGLPQALEACRCMTPQGKGLKARYRYFGPDERPLLEAELSAVDRLAEYVKHHPLELRNSQSLLAHFRDLRGTVAGLSKNRTLDLTELFEIKQAVRLLHKLLKMTGLLAKADITIHPLPEPEALLDPRGLGTSGFYLYDDYSPKLALFRQSRAELEKRMERAQGEERAELLGQRSQLLAGEAEEERAVRAALSGQLAPFADRLSDNLQAVGQLDFRLAKAQMALRWGASKPDLLEAGEAVILEQFHHPVIEDHLSARGTAYERQTTALARGTTVLTGANMGGKSVTLKAMTLSVLMIHLGYFPPADYAASPLFGFVSYSSDYFDTTKRGLSTFASEVVKIRDDIRQARQTPGFVVLDEPLRGTNPQEATALVGALCRFYASLPGVLVLATHYEVPAGEGIRHLRLRGIQTGDLEEIMEITKAPLLDEEAVRRIEALMDYSIEAMDGSAAVPTGAIRVARWLGLDSGVFEYLEEQE